LHLTVATFLLELMSVLTSIQTRSKRHCPPCPYHDEKTHSENGWHILFGRGDDLVADRVVNIICKWLIIQYCGRGKKWEQLNVNGF